MKHFVKISDFWYEYDPTTPMNETQVVDVDLDEDLCMDIREYERAQANQKKDLDWRQTIILNDKYRTGWLSPDGTFFGCEAYHHKLQAQYVHGMRETALENNGWIRINYMFQEDGNKSLVASFSAEDMTIYPTIEQLKYILNNYSDNKNLYYEIWHIANDRKKRIQEEWGI